MTTTKTNEAKAPEEGPRSFSLMLQQVSDGELHDDAGLKLQELVAYLRQFSDRYQRAAKGTLTLVVNVTALGNGSLVVDGDIKTKQPTAKRAGSVFYLTPGNNLTLENPRQQKLPLREVPLSTTRTKDLSTEAAPARGL